MQPILGPVSQDTKDLFDAPLEVNPHYTQSGRDKELGFKGPRNPYDFCKIPQT